MTNQTLSLLVHASAKVGKTTLGATTPAPRLILDAENGTKFLPQNLCRWDPLEGAPPVMDDGCETCITRIHDFESMQRVYQWLASGQHNFRSLTVDSITEIQRKCKQNVSGMFAPDQRQWGDILIQMELLLRDMRNLTEHPTKPLEAVVFIAETRQFDGVWRPYVQGQLAIELPYLFDVLGYLTVVTVPPSEQYPEGYSVRRLIVSPTPQYEAGERVQGRLGTYVDHPNIAAMLQAVFPTNTYETEGVVG